jgi:uncharacterized protein YndB with AHSA1/START domain
VPDDLASVRLTRRYHADPAEVWAALTDRDALPRWLGADHAPTWAAAEVREVEPERVLELDWRHRDEEPSILRVELSRDGETTVLVLDHRRLDAKVCMRYMRVWTDSLELFDRDVVA